MMANQVPSDDIVVRNARKAVSAELQKKRILGQPIAKFDAKTGTVYMENADGSTAYVAQAMKNGRYSERCG